LREERDLHRLRKERERERDLHILRKERERERESK
jgi:hypothetical protein